MPIVEHVVAVVHDGCQPVEGGREPDVAGPQGRDDLRPAEPRPAGLSAAVRRPASQGAGQVAPQVLDVLDADRRGAAGSPAPSAAPRRAGAGARSATRRRRGWSRAVQSRVAATRPARRPRRRRRTSIDDDRARSRGSGPAATAGWPASRPASSAALALARSTRRCRVRSPRRASQVSIGPAIAPWTAGGAGAARARRGRRRCPRSTVAPRMTSECPARYLVTECTTTSAPSVERLLARRGVAKVLSHDGERARARGPPRRGPAGRRPPASGWSGDSSQSRSAPSQGGERRPRCRLMSTRRRCIRPAASRSSSRSRRCRCRRASVPRRRRPSGTSDRAAATAAMPEAKTRASPPSSAPSASSNAVQVGLPARA